MDSPAAVTTPGRVLVAKPGMDAHWRGLAVVTLILRDAGFEIVYLGHASPEEITAAAAEEDVDVIGLSTLSGNHLEVATALLDLLGEHGMTDLPVIIGGLIPSADAEQLARLGVYASVGPGESAEAIVECVRSAVLQRRRHFEATG